jgi:tRNA U38,U39,U40 pseudouridine synthase TruA
MRTLKLVLEYDGFDYHGWQVQDHVVTIQGVIEAALEQILKGPIRVNGAGRTDAKVHALGQVASFSCTFFGARKSVRLSDSESDAACAVAVTLRVAYPAGLGRAVYGAGWHMPAGQP